jgi:hypothetical protein
MPCDKTALFDLLEILNAELDRKIALIAVGGTAMTLLDLKASTIDIDFTIPSSDSIEFKKVLKNNRQATKYIWEDGRVFCQVLPKDYLEKSIPIRKYSHILLKAINPLDIIVTKIGRLDKRDEADIKSCIDACDISESELRTRAHQVLPTYVGREEDYLYHLNLVIEKYIRKST